MHTHSELTYHYIWRLAWPMILANVSIPLLGMVDTAVVGHLDSPDYLGAVALGGLVFSFLFWGFGFLRMATTGLTAQAQGHNDNVILQQGLLLALLIATALLLLQGPILDIAFHILDSSPNIIHHAKTYVDIRIWSAPAILMNYVILGWLIGKSKTKAALVLVLIVNISNIILDLLLVNVAGLTVDGVALASVIAEFIGVIAAFILLAKGGISLTKIVMPISSLTSLFNKDWLSLNANIFIRTFCLILSFAFFTYQGAKQGDIILAANAILLHFITLMAFVLDGFANATEVITGKAVGNKDTVYLKRGLWLSGFLSFIVALMFSAVYFLFGSTIISLLTNIDEVSIVANQYLKWLIIAPLIAVWSYLFDGLYIGATRSREMRNTMLFATLCCYFPAWYLLQGFANHGLWLSLVIFLAARGLAQLIYLPQILKPKT